jgi:RNA polymerase sigma-70 factor (ECF subfamily)
MKAVEIGSAMNSWDDASDEELAQAAVAGRHCFLLLYERHIQRVQRYVFSQVTHATEVEDLVSTIFFRALTKIDTYQPQRGSFSAWLFAIARNAIHDHRRLTMGRRLIPLEAADGVPEPHAGPEELAVERERHDTVRRAFVVCTPEQRDALALRYLAELSFAEVAGALGKSEPAAKMLVRRGLDAIRFELEREGKA